MSILVLLAAVFWLSLLVQLPVDQIIERDLQFVFWRIPFAVGQFLLVIGLIAFLAWPFMKWRAALRRSKGQTSRLLLWGAAAAIVALFLAPLTLPIFCSTPFGPRQRALSYFRWGFDACPLASQYFRTLGEL